MLVVADWLRDGDHPSTCPVLIVDHGLRETSAREAKLVAEWAERAGLKAHVLTWRGRKPRANVEEKARNARYALMGDWCVANHVAQLLVAHTSDDQAETFLLRLGRGSGVDGLSAMGERAPFPLSGYRVDLIRPLLDTGRKELRDYLKAQGADWLEDPMNADSRFARTRIRDLLPRLESAGVSVSRIAKAAAHLSRARAALDEATAAFLAEHTRPHPQALLVDAQALRSAAREIGLRVLSSCLLRVGGATYRPRFERLEPLYDALISPGFEDARTLAGCRVGLAPKARRIFGAGTLEIRREGPRSTLSAAKKGVQTRSVTDLAAQPPHDLPKKGRIMPLPCNS